MSRAGNFSLVHSGKSLLTVLAALPFATLAGSIALSAEHLRSAFPVPGLAATAVTLALLALVQLRLLWRIGKQADLFSSVIQLPWREFGKCLPVAVVAIFGVALAVGDSSGGQFFLTCGCAVVATLLLLPIAAPHSAMNFWRRLGRRRWIRKSSLVAYSAALFVITGELMLQGVARLPISSASRTLSPTTQASFASPEQFLSDAATAARVVDWKRDQLAGLRLAMVGDDETLDMLTSDLVDETGSDETGLAVRRFPNNEPGSKRAARQLAEEVTAAQPELVLAVVSVAEDFGREATKGWIHWRNFQIPRYVARLSGYAPGSTSKETAGTVAYQQLSVCSKNASSETRAQWRRLSEQITILAARCREKGVPMALIVMPAKFQLNRPAREALLHQAGYDSDSIDIELPQRRLAALAQRQQIPLLDLMPELRLSNRSLYQRNGDALNGEGRTIAQQAMCDWIDRSVGSDRLLLADLRSAR